MCYDSHSNRFVFYTLLFTSIIANVLPASPGDPPAETSYHHSKADDQLREMFAKVVFYKPEVGTDALPIEQAPLIAQGVPLSNWDAALGQAIGAVSWDPTGKIRVDVDAPAIYFDERRISIQGNDYIDRVFDFYSRGLKDPNSTVEFNRIHLILDTDGNPIVAVVRDSHIEMQRRICGRRFFVSEAFEKAALERFGTPLPGRQFAAEEERKDYCSPRVVGTFATGPMPMGLYIYVQNKGNITTLRCRCSPALMSEIVETKTYQLLALDTLRERSSKGGYFMWEKDFMERFLDEVLRWPFDPPSDNPSNEDRRDIP